MAQELLSSVNIGVSMKIITSEYRDLLDWIHPDAGLSDHDKNEITTGSKQPLPFICPCGHGTEGDWITPVRDRINKKSCCLRKCKTCGVSSMSSKRRLPKRGCSLRDKCPELADEFDNADNLVTSREVGFSTNDIYNWKCKYCQKIFPQSPNARTGSQQQGHCHKKFSQNKSPISHSEVLALVDQDDLSRKQVILVERIKNAEDKVKGNHSTKLLFYCKNNKGHGSYPSLLRQVFRGVEYCKICSGREPDTGNDFYSLNQHWIEKDWLIGASVKLNLQKTMPNNNRYEFTLECKQCGNQEKRSANHITQRTKKTGIYHCSPCSGRVLGPKNNAMFLHKDVVDEFWDYEEGNNIGVFPETTIPGSETRIPVKCPNCMNKWMPTAHHFFIDMTRCGKCSHANPRIERLLRGFMTLVFNQVDKIKIPYCGEADIYIDSLKLVIEYDGEVWHKYDTDLKKNKDFKKHGYNIINIREGYHKKDIRELDDNSIIWKHDLSVGPVQDLLRQIFSKITNICVNAIRETEISKYKTLSDDKIEINNLLLQCAQPNNENTKLSDHCSNIHDFIDPDNRIDPDKVARHFQHEYPLCCKDCGNKWVMPLNKIPKIISCPACAPSKSIKNSYSLRAYNIEPFLNNRRLIILGQHPSLVKDKFTIQCVECDFSTSTTIDRINVKGIDCNECKKKSDDMRDVEELKLFYNNNGDKKIPPAGSIARKIRHNLLIRHKTNSHHEIHLLEDMVSKSKDNIKDQNKKNKYLQKIKRISDREYKKQSAWTEQYNRYCKLNNGHGQFNSNEIKKIEKWEDTQRQAYANGNLDPYRFSKLESSGFIWNKYLIKWQEMFAELKTFTVEQGHSNVPQRYPANPSLGRWCSKQRQDYKKGTLAADKIALLEGLGFSWDPIEI
jgi:hypothetical protein